MKARIKRVDKSLPLPQYHTEGSVGFDITCREDTTIKPGEIALIPGNIIVETPKGYMLLVALRSSTPMKHSLIKPHGIGIIDNDYCGENDEIKVQVYNYGDKETAIKKGERIAQGVFVRIEKPEWEEQETMGKSRGGFGSTG